MGGVPGRSAGAGLPDAVDDDARQDQDHAHDHDEMRPDLGHGELVAVFRGGGHKVQTDVGKAADEQQNEAEPNDKR